MSNNELLIQKLLESNFTQKGDEFCRDEIKVKSIESSAYHSKREIVIHDNDIIMSFAELEPTLGIFDEALEKAYFFLSDFDDMMTRFMGIQKIKPRETLVYKILRSNMDIFYYQHQGKDCMNVTFKENILSHKSLPHINPIWWRVDITFSFVQFEARSFEMSIFPRDSFNMGLDAKVFINEMYAQEAFLKGFEQIKDKTKNLLLNANLNF